MRNVACLALSSTLTRVHRQHFYQKLIRTCLMQDVLHRRFNKDTPDTAERPRAEHKKPPLCECWLDGHDDPLIPWARGRPRSSLLSNTDSPRGLVLAAGAVQSHWKLAALSRS